MEDFVQAASAIKAPSVPVDANDLAADEMIRAHANFVTNLEFFRNSLLEEEAPSEPADSRRADDSKTRSASASIQVT